MFNETSLIVAVQFLFEAFGIQYPMRFVLKLLLKKNINISVATNVSDK